MKKCSTGVLWLALTGTSFGSFAATCDFLDTAPASYQVRPGDTLWDLANTFLADPWCWPQVWEGNRDQIRDPHWIYPGQNLLIDRQARRLLSDARKLLPNVQLSPTIREDPRLPSPIPASLPLGSGGEAHSSLIDPVALERAPRITGFADGRRMAGRHDLVLATGDMGTHLQFDVVRASLPVHDPDSREAIAVVSTRIGSLTLLGSKDGVHRLRVTRSASELLAEDRLQPPQAPSPAASLRLGGPVAGKVAAVMAGRRWASLHDVVVLNRGARDGLSAGHLVAAVRQARIPADATAPDAPATALSHETIATLVILEVSERASLARIVRARDVLSAGDLIRTSRSEMQ